VESRAAREGSPLGQPHVAVSSRLVALLQSLISDTRMHMGTSSAAPSAKKAGKPVLGITNSFSPYMRLASGGDETRSVRRRSSNTPPMVEG
jgi:hypothetical protein